MIVGIRFKIVWWDKGVLQVRVAASNGELSGQTDVYVRPSALTRLAKELEDFPRNPTDVRVINLGAGEENQSGGHVTLKFSCTDSANDPIVDVAVQPPTMTKSPAADANAVGFQLRFDVAGGRRFSRRLYLLEINRFGLADLAGAK